VDAGPLDIKISTPFEFCMDWNGLITEETENIL